MDGARTRALIALFSGAALVWVAPLHSYAQDAQGDDESELSDEELIDQMLAEEEGDSEEEEVDESEMSDEDLISMMLDEEEDLGIGGEETGDNEEDFGPADSLGFDSLGEALGGEGGVGFRLPLFGESTFSVVNTTIAELRSNDFADGQFMRGATLASTLVERMQLILQGEELRAELRIDAFVPFTSPKMSACPTPSTILCNLSWDLRPERMNILWTPNTDWSVQIGDAHAVLGRGIAISMRKIDQLGIDTTVRGGYAQYDGGDFYFKALGGLGNPQNLDPLTLQIHQDPIDVFAGGEAGFRVGPNEDLEVGFHAVNAWFQQLELSPTQTDGLVGGWHAAMPSLLGGTVALYAEVDAMRREDTNPEGEQERRWGRAVYGSAQVTRGNTSVLAQWKDYKDYILEPIGNLDQYRVYSAAPSLDFDTERYRGIPNSRGGQLEITYTFNPSPWAMRFTGVGYGHTEDPHVDPWSGIFAGHGLLTLSKLNDSTTDQELGYTLDLSGGYRREVYMSDTSFVSANAGELDWEVGHAIIDLNIGYGAHSFDFRAEPRFERRRRPFPITVDPNCQGINCNATYNQYVRGGVYLTWSFAGRLHLSFNLQWNSERPNQGPFFPSGEVKWEFIRGTHVRLRVGANPGGLLCSGGVCRDVPPFEGGQFELVVRI